MRYVKVSITQNHNAMKNNDLKPNYVGTFLTDVRFMLQTEDFVKALPPVQSLRPLVSFLLAVFVRLR